ncbi:MAG: beta-galactosidase, partial [Armatimonadota bacterium]
RPMEIDAILVNPGMGWTTFHSFEGDERNENYPQSSIAYFRYYWDELEPERGHVRWELIDEAMEKAHERGQDFAFRIMPTNGVPKTPQWLRDLGCKGKEFNDGKSWQPDYSDPVYLEHMGRLVAEAGRRYDGHPHLDHVDIGSLGRWGEWHTSGTGMEMPPFEVKKQIVDMYLNAFRKTPLVALIGDSEALRYAVSHGTGWRADCLGDLGGFSETWNHMEFYPKQLADSGATEAWKLAPVCFETCWTMQFWHDRGWDVEWIFEQALKMHVSVVNNKSSPVPADWWPAVNEFSRRMGYRLVLRELEHPRRLAAGDAFELRMVWETSALRPAIVGTRSPCNCTRRGRSACYGKRQPART